MRFDIRMHYSGSQDPDHQISHESSSLEQALGEVVRLINGLAGRLGLKRWFTTGDALHVHDQYGLCKGNYGIRRLEATDDQFEFTHIDPELLCRWCRTRQREVVQGVWYCRHCEPEKFVSP